MEILGLKSTITEMKIQQLGQQKVCDGGEGTGELKYRSRESIQSVEQRTKD